MNPQLRATITGWHLLAALSVLLLILTTLSVAAPLGQAEATTGSARAKAVLEPSGPLVTGLRSRLSATTTPARKNRPVELQRRAGGKWTKVVVRRTGPGGRSACR